MSTDGPDTDTDAEDLAEAFPRVAELEQELKEADIDVGDIPQRKGTTRRDLLAGSAGLLGLGGVLTAGSGTASAGDGQVGSLGTDGNRLDAEIEDLDLTDQSSTPAGPGSGQVRFYAKNGTLYYKSAGGSETQVGGGAGIFEDTNSDGVYEQTTGSGIETQSVSTGSLQYTEGYKSEEDDNSPFSESGSQSHTVSISGSYTKVILDFKKIVNDHGSAQDIVMQVDGVTSPNYTYRLADGTTTTGGTEFVLSPGIESGGVASGKISFDGRISDSDDINVINNVNSGNEAIMTNGTIFNLPSGGPGDPIGQFTIKGSAGNIDVAGRIIGVTL